MVRSVAILGPLPDVGSIGGVATHTAALASELRGPGVAATVFADSHVAGKAPGGAYGVRGAGAMTRAGLVLRGLRPDARAIAALAALGVPESAARSRALLIADAARRTRPDVIHVQQADFRPLYADAAGLTAPRIITVHGLGALETLEYPGLAQAIPENLRACSAVTTPSRALAEEVVRLGADPDRITVIPNGVDHRVFKPRDRAEARAVLGIDQESPLVVFAGRVTRHKGAGDLLDCWPAVREALPAATLALVGPSGDIEVPALPGIRVVGGVAPAVVATWFAAADVVAVPSRYEGFGLSALEAMACARPVVATRVGGLPEIVSEETGTLVPVRDAGALTEALVRALESAQWRRDAGTAAERVAARFTWSAAAAAFAALYERVSTR